jgi:hypothetical protein
VEVSIVTAHCEAVLQRAGRDPHVVRRHGTATASEFPVHYRVMFEQWRWSLVHRPSKGLSVHTQANDDVVHLRRFREADGLAHQALAACPYRQMLALNLRRLSLLRAMDSSVEMTRGGAPIIRRISRDPIGLQQGFHLQQDRVLSLLSS